MGGRIEVSAPVLSGLEVVSCEVVATGRLALSDFFEPAAIGRGPEDRVLVVRVRKVDGSAREGVGAPRPGTRG